MLYGTGCDLCSIERMAKSLSGAHAQAFINRVFGNAEIKALRFCDASAIDTHSRARAHSIASAAANFAAKEAFLKAAGTGLTAPFSLCEIEAVRLPSGKPEYSFSGKTAQWVQEHNVKAHLSLSHDGGMAMAFCILEVID